MTAQVIRLAAYRDLTPELAATHRRLERLQRAKDAALLSLQADLEDEVSRVGLTPGAVLARTHAAMFGRSPSIASFQSSLTKSNTATGAKLRPIL